MLQKALRKSSRFATYCATAIVTPEIAACIEPLAGDTRFVAEGWRKQPFCFLVQAFLLNQQWWHNVTHEVPGVSPHHEDVVSFATRQWLDIFSPSNIPWLNPSVIERTRATGGVNFMRGFSNFQADMARLASHQLPVGAEAFVPGRDVAVTPGKVVYRNDLIELIQYAPTTKTVFAEPVLIVPAWIMKFYILDLSPENSLVRYLVEKGHTVFCVSWRNPDARDRDLRLDDYRRKGVVAALDAIKAFVPDERIHATGYCLGGTLLSIAAADMARTGDESLASLTLLAAQTDFSEPGELALFIDHSQMHFLESMMWDKGYLSADQMAGAFELLHTNDLVWSRMVYDYLVGERRPMSDLMAWNADTTRMPYKMHAEYLQRLYLDNELAAGRFLVDGRPADLQNIRAPMFIVGAERDHVAPWRSVYTIHYHADTEITFLLTSGGHNAGIISEPGHPHRHYRMAVKHEADLCLGPDEWVTRAKPIDGSWWIEWTQWLEAHSTPNRVTPPKIDAPIEDAPGTYVFQR